MNSIVERPIRKRFCRSGGECAGTSQRNHPLYDRAEKRTRSCIKRIYVCGSRGSGEKPGYSGEETEDLFSRELIANDVNLISVDHIEGEMRVKAKVRYRHEEQWATVTQPEPDKIRVVFDEPQRAITCGQAVVLYDGDVVVGGATNH